MKLDIKSLPAKLSELLDSVGRYAVILFCVLVALVYGFLVMRINSLNSVQPDSSTVTAQANTATPHIDPKLVQQLQSLQDNSVSVKSLFDQARSNPFDE